MRSYIPKDARLVPETATCVFKGVIFEVYQWPQTMFDGSTETFEMLKRPDTVIIIAIRDGKIVVLEQEQPGTGVFFDLPSGRHDVEGEDELQAAQRELLEETGMIFKNWKLIETESPHSKIEWIRYTYLATDFVSETMQNLDVGEKIKVHLMTFDDIKKIIQKPEAHFLKLTFEKYNSLEELLAAPSLT